MSATSSATPAIRILGIDPGSRLTGYGCVDLFGTQIKLVTHGTLKLAKTSGKATVPFEQRLLLLHQGLTEIIREFKPHVMAVEKVFFAKDAVSRTKSRSRAWFSSSWAPRSSILRMPRTGWR
jgi:crossover junction endodeoxyribonuclease RuvC